MSKEKLTGFGVGGAAAQRLGGSQVVRFYVEEWSA